MDLLQSNTKYFVVLYDNEPYFFCGKYDIHYKYAEYKPGEYLKQHGEDGWRLHIIGESFNEHGILIRTREYQVCYNEPVEITKEQFDMFKKEILKIQKLKDMFNTTATALYKSKSNASNKELHTTL